MVQTEAYGYGGFTDILAEVAGGGTAVIENQLELSDNDHFVRLVGYAADHDAKILIWVAPQFDEYHQRLLGWLDQALGDDRSIHAVQVKLVPSGDLRPADADPEAPGFRAEFSRVPLRNDWPQWSTLTPSEASELNQRYRDFFQTMTGDLRREGFTDRSIALAGNDQSFPTDFAGISYNVGFWNSGGGKPSLDVYLWIAANETERNQADFRRSRLGTRTKLEESCPASPGTEGTICGCVRFISLEAAPSQVLKRTWWNCESGRWTGWSGSELRLSRAWRR